MTRFVLVPMPSVAVVIRQGAAGVDGWAVEFEAVGEAAVPFRFHRSW